MALGCKRILFSRIYKKCTILLFRLAGIFVINQVHDQ